MSYLIQTDEISLANQERLRQQAIRAAKERALSLTLVTPGREDRFSSLTERDADFVTDFITWGGGAVVAIGGWNSMPLLVRGTAYNVFMDSAGVAVNPVVPNNTVVVFYKISILTIAPADPVSMLWFRTGASQNMKAQFDIEVLYSKLSADGYFSKPVVFDPQEIMNVTVEARVATLVTCRVRLGCFVIEPTQVTLI